MNFNDFVKFILAEGERFKSVVSNEAKTLRLSDVLDFIADAFSPELMQYARVEEGEEIEVALNERDCTASVRLDEAALRYHGINLLTLRGIEVKEQYEKMMSAIQDIKTRGGYNLPF